MAPANPVALINADRISKSYGIKPLLDSVSLGVHEGQRIGVVGLNGGGKTTLLEILGGITEPDSGRVSRAGDIRVATVTQRGELPAGATVSDVVVGGPQVAVHEQHFSVSDPAGQELNGKTRLVHLEPCHKVVWVVDN